MANPTLKRGVGFSNQSPELRQDVKRLQLALEKAGYSVDTDGLFGEGTETVVKTFQRDRGLGADGIVGAATWQALEGNGDAPAAPVPAAAADTPTLPDASSALAVFRGDAQWVHAREGHLGKPYWPGGQSGVTFDPGIDLGYAASDLIDTLYRPITTAEQFEAAQRVLGLKKEAARDALGADAVLQGVRISRAQADAIFPYAAEPYWNAIVGRFPSLTEPDTLPAVQTVMLSLAYNRGAGNRGLEELRPPLEAKNWSEVADLVGAMQQDHPLEGIRKRRRMEAELIRTALA